jgi:hypothetical protein
VPFWREESHGGSFTRVKRRRVIEDDPRAARAAEEQKNAHIAERRKDKKIEKIMPEGAKPILHSREQRTTA